MTTATLKQAITIPQKNLNRKSRPNLDDLTTTQLEKALNEVKNM